MNLFMVPNHKKRRLLHAFMFVMIDEITVIQKMVGKKSFSNQAKASTSSISMRRNVYSAQS